MVMCSVRKRTHSRSRRVFKVSSIETTVRSPSLSPLSAQLRLRQGPTKGPRVTLTPTDGDTIGTLVRDNGRMGRDRVGWGTDTRDHRRGLLQRSECRSIIWFSSVNTNPV